MAVPGPGDGVPVADRHNEYAETVFASLRQAGIRAEVDISDETVGEKIRRAITDKHPAVIVVGDRDVEPVPSVCVSAATIQSAGESRWMPRSPRLSNRVLPRADQESFTATQPWVVFLALTYPFPQISRLNSEDTRQ